MFKTLYREWPMGCLPAALFLLVILFSSKHQFHQVIWLIWLQVPIYLLHEFEEHAYPGGFKLFINQKIFGSKIPDCPLSDASVFWINIPFIWIMFPFFAIVAQHHHIELGIILPCFALLNATTHIIVGIVKRQYNPGLLVSVFLNYPTGIYLLYVMSQHGLLNVRTNLIGWGAAVIGHLCMLSYAVIHYRLRIK